MNKAGSGGTKKIGRNRDKCAKFALKHTRERNKIRKYKKIIKGLPANNDTCVELKNRIRELEKVIL